MLLIILFYSDIYGIFNRETRIESNDTQRQIKMLDNNDNDASK